MLLQLPKEIVLNIVSCLDFHDKLSLMKTCRWLNEVIAINSLYRELSIPGKLQVTREVLKRFKNKELNGNQVKKLKLHLNYLTNQQYRRLPLIFPNVTELINANSSDSSNNNRHYYANHFRSFSSMSNPNYSDINNERERHEYVLEPMLNWKDSIETYDTRNGHLQIAQLIQKNTFSRLVTLYFKPVVFNLGSRQSGMDVNIFDCFKNAPQLSNLILCDLEVDLEFMEKIHVNCPRLHSLLFRNVAISTKNSILPQVIEPTETLSSLILEERTSFTDSIFLDYISLKYKNLRYLEFFSRLNSSGIRRHQDGIFIGPRQTLGVYHNTNIFTNYSPHNDQTGLVILPQLPSAIKVLKMNPTHFGNIMESLDQAGINPTKLEFCQEQTQKYLSTNENIHEYFDVINDLNQLCYLEKATSLKTLSLAMKTIVQSYRSIVSETITELNTCIKGASNNDKIDLGWILSAFPSLEALNIYSSTSTIEAIKSNIHKVYPNLKRIKIIDCNIHPDLFDYIRIAAPNVTHLTFTVQDQINQSVDIPAYQQPIQMGVTPFGVPPYHLQPITGMMPSVMESGLYLVNLPPIWNFQEGSSLAQPISLDDEPEQPRSNFQSSNLQNGSSYAQPISLDDESDDESSNFQDKQEETVVENILYKFNLSDCNIDTLHVLTRLKSYQGESREILLQLITETKTMTYTFIVLGPGNTRNISAIHTLNDRLRSLPKITVICNTIKQLNVDLGITIKL